MLLTQYILNYYLYSSLKYLKFSATPYPHHPNHTIEVFGCLSSIHISTIFEAFKIHIQWCVSAGWYTHCRLNQSKIVCMKSKLMKMFVSLPVVWKSFYSYIRSITFDLSYLDFLEKYFTENNELFTILNYFLTSAWTTSFNRLIVSSLEHQIHIKTRW